VRSAADSEFVVVVVEGLSASLTPVGAPKAEASADSFFTISGLDLVGASEVALDSRLYTPIGFEGFWTIVSALVKHVLPARRATAAFHHHGSKDQGAPGGRTRVEHLFPGDKHLLSAFDLAFAVPLDATI
jgi:hypothetical protein